MGPTRHGEMGQRWAAAMNLYADRTCGAMGMCEKYCLAAVRYVLC